MHKVTHSADDSSVTDSVYTRQQSVLYRPVKSLSYLCVKGQ